MKQVTPKDILSKINDYTRFGHVLLALSVFLYLSLLIPSSEKEFIQFAIIITANLTFLGLAFHYYYQVVKLKKYIKQSKDNS